MVGHADQEPDESRVLRRCRRPACDRDHVEVAPPRVEAPERERSVHVHADQPVAEDPLQAGCEDVELLHNRSWPANAPRPVNAAAPHLEASATASGTAIPAARPYVSPAANESPAPYESTMGPGSGAAANGPPGSTTPPSRPSVETRSRGGGSSSAGS